VQRIFAWAKQVGWQRAQYVLDDRPVPAALRLQYALADRLVFSKIKAVFGGRIRYFVTGAAPTPRPVLEFFWAAGLPIYEVYGMTEATVATHMNVPSAVRLGTVGRPLGPMEHRIAADGELLLRGPWVFKGYYKNEAATAEIIKDGWLHTGDIGTIDGAGYLRITDRKKHLIITAGGKNLSPGNIESAIKEQDALISQVVPHGDNRPYVSALIAPSPLETLEWGVQHGVLGQAELAARQQELVANPSGRTEALNAAMAQVVTHPDFQRRFIDAVRRANQHLAHVEQVRRFVLLDRDLSQEHGEMTPSMKVKRKEVERLYAQQLDRLYADEKYGLNA
jgi:long-chain acyl-CoA synthetase